MSKAIGYARVSTEEQAREGVSIDAQVEKIRAYAALQGLELLDLVVDAGESGGKRLADRPGGARVLELLDAGEASALVVYKLDRLGRRALDVLGLVDELGRRGVALHSISEKLDTESAIGRFVLVVLAGLAAMERDQVRERTRFAMQHKAAKGEAVSRAPRGLRIAGGRLVADPSSDGLRMLKRARELRQQGFSYRAIAGELEAGGFRPERGARIGASTVRYMLSNPRLGAVTDAA
jgi:DNA invertase Pin-like site-specific DNA recombinase